GARGEAAHVTSAGRAGVGRRRRGALIQRASEVGEPLELEQRAALASAVAGQDVRKSSIQCRKYSPESPNPRYLSAASIVQSWTLAALSSTPGASAPGRNSGVPSESRKIVSSGFPGSTVPNPWFFSCERARLVPIRGVNCW